MIRWLLTIFLGLQVAGQDVFTLYDYYNTISENHPVFTQSDLQETFGEALVLYQRGLFDPKIKSNYDAKEFKETQYYDMLDAKLEVPIWLNTDLKLGYERNLGSRLNNDVTQTDGLVYAGISVPIGRGLFFDPRRLAVKSAYIDQENTFEEARLMRNDLMIMAADVYWAWFQAYNMKQIADSAYELSLQRFRLVKIGAENGDYPIIDTVETKIQVQLRRNEQIKADVNYANAQIQLQNFLINNSGVPVEDVSEFLPDQVRTSSLDTLDINASIENHPELQLLFNQYRQYDLERKWAVESFKPQLDFNYNFINETVGVPDEVAFFQNNYKVGLSFEFPILLRKERGKLQQITIKQQQNELKRVDKRIIIETKAENLLIKISQTREMIRQMQEMVQGYERLLEAERIKFLNGDSNIFMINSRENKLIEARNKLVELEADYGFFQEELKWVLGILGDLAL